ncbi:S-adenosyl-L-methionine-dependent methyltransferase [Catenaria anguillulae PL171]|uniref:Protein arginine methyltransferase NDUFAF7 n=1 Tax=Catenaria anguillulae PL171 TaxID=765915 RepID=A0A1Y2HNF5_9FUNG|nr:S-adenosyl-L-methionine-dependent methyltransferase [Catenaria anguillulae PL171]
MYTTLRIMISPPQFALRTCRAMSSRFCLAALRPVPPRLLHGASPVSHSRQINARGLSTPAIAVPDTAPSTDTGKEPITPLVKEMADEIRFRGPLSVSQYMRRCLTHPVYGYYMQQQVFGAKGDFITSPEISQMFGELIGVWFMTNWLAMESPKRVQIVELGPGRGTLVADMIRSLNQFRKFQGVLQRVVLVEASPKLREVQLESITKAVGAAVDREERNEFKHLEKVWLTNGMQVAWYENLADIQEEDYTFLVAHEFFDALPVFKFKKTDQGWREIMVDVDDSPETPYHFRYVIAPEKTQSVTALIEATGQYDHHAEGDVIEVCPEATGYMHKIADLLGKCNGSGLIMDYGNDKPANASLRAIRNHQFTHLFSHPGLSDLSADVDFSLLKWSLEPYSFTASATSGKPLVKHWGPTTQRHFLARMGIEDRARQLLRAADTHERKMDVRTAMTRLMAAKQMGVVYKMMAVASGEIKGTPAGFELADFPSAVPDPQAEQKGPEAGK